MDQDHVTNDYLQVDHPAKVEPVPEDTVPAVRERSSSDSPKSSLEGIINPGHSAYMSPRLRSILLWEKPVVSAAHLGAALMLILLCRWVSLLNLVCGLLVAGISGSFLYVNGMLLLGRVTNKPTARPLEKYYQRSAEFIHVEADTLHRQVGYITDGLNVIVTELAKVVLIEDNERSLKYIGIFYALWTLRTWFSMTTLLAAVLVSLFAVPRIYIDNQQLIDSQVAKTNDLVQEHVGKGRQVAQDQWTAVYSKAEQFAQDKGLLKTQKTE